MDLNAYQAKARSTAIYPDLGNNLIYPVLGLLGEAGEVAEKVKKMVRDDGGELSDDRREAIRKELGDVLWYVSQVAAELDSNLDDIADMNIRKLEDRFNRGKIKGSGDDR